MLGFSFLFFYAPLVFSIFTNQKYPADPGKNSDIIKRKQQVPLVTLSFNETRTIDLDSFYDGTFLTYKLQPPEDLKESVNLTLNKAISNSSSFTLIDKIIAQEFLLSNEALFSGILLTEQGELLSVNLINWRTSQAEFIVIDNYTLNTNLSCFTFVLYNHSKVILDCRGKNDSKNYFSVIDFQMSNNNAYFTLMQTPPRYFPESSSGLLEGTPTQDEHRLCNRTLKLGPDLRLFRFCKSSISLDVSHFIEVFDYDNGEINQVRTLNPSKSMKGTSQFYLQAMEIYNQDSLYLLDYFTGPYSFRFDSNSDMILISNFPTVFGEKFLDMEFECYGRTGIHNVFQQCKIVVLSSHYITELSVGSNFSDQVFLIKRTNLMKENAQTSYFSVSNRYVFAQTVLYNDANVTEETLNIYNREDSNTRLFRSFTLPSQSTVMVVNRKSQYSLGFIDTSLIVIFSSKNSSVSFVTLSSNSLTVKCCDLHCKASEIKFKLIVFQENKPEISLTEDISVKIVNISDSRIAIFNESLQNITMNFDSPSFSFPIENLVYGPNQKFDLENPQGLSLEINEMRNYVLPFQRTKNIIYLKGLRLFNDIYFFSQSDTFELKAYKCDMKIYQSLLEEENESILENAEDLFYTEPENPNCVEKYSQQLYTGIKILLAKEHVILFNFVNNPTTFYSIVLENNLLVFKGISFSDESQSNCSFLLFNPSASHMFCSFKDVNKPKFLLFDPFQGKNRINISTVSASTTSEMSHQKILLQSSITENLTYEYFDVALMSEGFVFGKLSDQIHILQIRSFGDSSDINLIGVIFNEFTTTRRALGKKDIYNGYAFLISPSSPVNGIDPRIVIINYDKNIVGEFSLKNLSDPAFIRYYPLYNHRLCFLYHPTLRNNIFTLFVQKERTNNSDPLSFFFLYDVTKETGTTLIKVMPGNNVSFPVRPVDSNKPDYEDGMLDFLQEDGPNWCLKRLRRPTLRGKFKFENISISGVAGKSGLNVSEHSGIPNNISLNVKINNDFNSNQPVNLQFKFLFSLGNAILNFSQELISSESAANLTTFDFSNETVDVKLSTYFQGPAYDYFISGLGSSYFTIIKHIMPVMSLDLLAINMPLANTPINAYFEMLGRDVFSDSFSEDNNLFLLYTTKLLLIDMETGSKKSELYFDHAKFCSRIFHHKDWNHLYVVCWDVETRSAIPLKRRLFFIGYSSEGFPNPPQEIKLPENIKYIYDIKATEDLLFLMERDQGNLGEPLIVVLQVEFKPAEKKGYDPFGYPAKHTEEKMGENFEPFLNAVELTTINAMSFNLDYLFLYNFDVYFLGNIKENLAFGIVFSDLTYLFYCEFLLNKKNEDPQEMNPLTSTLIIKKWEAITLDEVLANKEEKILNTYWVNLNETGMMNIFIVSNMNNYEISTSRFAFPLYTVANFFRGYHGCQHIPLTKPLYSNVFFVAVCEKKLSDEGTNPEPSNQVIININLYLRKEVKEEPLLSLSRGQTQIQENIRDIVQMQSVNKSLYSRLFFRPLTRMNNEDPSGIINMLLKNGTLQSFALRANISVKKCRNLKKNESEIRISERDIIFWAKNDYSNISLVIKAINFNDLPDSGLLKTVLLVFIPIIFCFLIMCAILMYIKVSKEKRMELLRRTMENLNQRLVQQNNSSNSLNSDYGDLSESYDRENPVLGGTSNSSDD